MTFLLYFEERTKSPTVSSSSHECLNCLQPLDPADKFCRQCGQNSATHRFTLPHILHEFFHAFTHTDKSIFSLVLALFTRPGKLVAEYLDGKRKKVFNPFTFLLLVAAFSVLVLSLTKANDKLNTKPHQSNSQKTKESNYTNPDIKPGEKGITRIPTAREVEIRTRANNVNSFMQKRQNLVMIIAVPFNALIFFIGFRKKGRNYAEHLVANVFFVGIVILFTSIIFYPLMAVYNRPPVLFWLLGAMLLSHVLYYAWAYAQLFSIRSAGGKIAVVGVSLLAILLWSAISRALILMYIMGSFS